jgi:hypothetical protein
MLTRVCRCCGGWIQSRVENPNICVLCDEMSWELEAPQLPPLIYTASAADLMAGADLGESSDSFLTLDEPTVVECLDAEHDAQKAIAEVDSIPHLSEPLPQAPAHPGVKSHIER